MTSGEHGGARKGAGRKPHGKNRAKLQLEVAADAEGRKLTPAQRHAALKRQVALCVADSMTEDAIAAVLQIPVERLLALFARELQHGREIVRAELLARLDMQSEDGNVAAGKAILTAATGGAKEGHSDLGRGDATNRENDAVTRAALRVLNGGKSDAK